MFKAMDDVQVYNIILFLASSVLSAVIVRAIIAKTRAHARLPPSPLALPIIGHLHLLGPQPHKAFHKLSNRYGPLIHLSLGSVPCVVASSPEMAKEFLKTHEPLFLNCPPPSVMDTISYPEAYFSFSEYGTYWKFMKKLCMSRLLGGQTLDQFAPIRAEETKRFLNLVLERARANQEVDLGGELLKLANNTISRMVTSRRCADNEGEAVELRKAVTETFELLGKFNLSDHIWLLNKFDLQGILKKGKVVHEKFDKMIETIIKEHQEQKSNDRVKDLVDILLEVSEDQSSEIRLTRDNIKAFILDVFIAGTDTTAITTEWAMAELINHPTVMNKARNEIESVIGKTRVVEESDIPNLPYIQAIIKETLRLHPTGPLIPRQSTESCTVNGYHIPEKTRLFVNVWAIGRDPNHWKDPLEFIPERFLVEQGMCQVDVRGQNYQLLPFGSGRRACPGITLALQIIHTNIATMIQCFDWKVDGVVDMEEGIGLTLPRARPLICVPICRLQSPLKYEETQCNNK